MTISKENDRIMITVPRELKERLVLKAAQENRSLSNYIVALIQSKEMKEDVKTR